MVKPGSYFSTWVAASFASFIVTEPAVGGGEVGVRLLRRVAAGDRLVAPFDCLFPLGEMGVEVANIVLPPCHGGSRGLRRRAVSTSAKPSSAWPRNIFSKPALAIGAGVVSIVGDRLFRLRDRCPHWRLAKYTSRFAICADRIVRLNGQGGVNRLFRALRPRLRRLRSAKSVHGSFNAS